MREAFQKWDQDGNGTIEREELARVLSALGEFKASDIDRIMVEVDRNADGQIQYTEFVDWLMRPVVTAGAAALLSTSELCLRADQAPLGNPTARGGVEKRPSIEPRWIFSGHPGSNPVRLEAAKALRAEHTIVVWAMPQAVDGDWAQIVGDSRSGWGFSIGFSKRCRLGVRDPRLQGSGGGGELCIETPTDVEHGRWAMFVARGICTSASPSATGCTEFLVASDDRALRFLGTVQAVGGGVVVEEIGSKTAGVKAIGSVVMWPKLLADEELRELFLWDAVRFGCLTEEQAAWLRKNRRCAPARTEEEEEELGRRLATAAAGKFVGLLDLSELKVVDADLPRILDAVESAFEDVTALSLGVNYITEDGVIEHIVPFLGRLTSHFRLDLRQNSDINNFAEGPLLEVFGAAPESLGLSVDLRGTGVGGDAMLKLLNQTPEAADAIRLADRERKKAAEQAATYQAQQAAISERWKDEVDAPVAFDGSAGTAFDNAVDLATGIGLASASFSTFPVGKQDQLKEIRASLARAARMAYDHAAGGLLAWEPPSGSDSGRGPAPENCGTGQFIAHFSYLSYAVQPRSHEDFGLRLRSKGEQLGAGRAKKGAIGLHAAAENGAVRVAAASGKSYGRDAVKLRLESRSDKPLCIAVVAGTIFQHISWIHRQNLLVGRTVHIYLQPGESQEHKIGAFCMNLSCACSNEDPMELTALELKDTSILQGQGKVWDFFEGLFSKYRAEAGFPDGAKKGKKGKKGAGSSKKK
eukprot:CAMPEP_0115413958 /NCGR_PEP_ID=MMETSP0271-20121206/22340_1 /TAXON_ID=71861 /ORGANISM="Scrippsiella trochoidea, Strain CCMP3099" /LENGTH=754 /DNA_ID=CAMNT_0002838257 /DNA_START=9 /DNA_END=2273 /DNA_ORIENTATION=-